MNKNLINKNVPSTLHILMMIMTFAYVVLSACANEAELKRTHFLLFDSRIIENTENAKLTVGKVQKHEANPLFVEDKLWEKRFDNLYGNVIYDVKEEIYKCWYSPFIVDQSALGMSLKERDENDYDPPDNREMAICYATSKDGLTWHKPELGLVGYNQSKANNILWRGSGDGGEHWGGPHGSGIFKDYREQDENRLYKALLKGQILSVAFSANGINWGPAITTPEADVAGDTHNNAFWAPSLNKYVGITRSWGKEKGRQVVRIESEDFIKWTKAEVVLEGIEKNQQTYAMPAFYYGGVYLGLVAIHDQKTDRVWTELTWSPDTREWNRISPGTPLIPNSDTKLDYDYGCVYPCAYPVFLKDEIRLYYGGSDYLHYGWRNGSLCLATLRPDGFAGFEQENDDQEAVINTKNINYSGQDIMITADVDQGGWIKALIIDNQGNSIASAEEIREKVSNGILSFKKPVNAGKIRLQFKVSNAKIYSFRFDG